MDVPIEAAAGAVAGVLLVSLLVWLASRRSVAHRLSGLAYRLEDSAPSGRRREGLEALIHRLERATSAAGLRSYESAVAVERMRSTLDVLPDGIVICDDEGRVVFRNEAGQPFEGARNADVLAEQTVTELLQAAVLGEAAERTVDLYGPPRRNLRIRAEPLTDGRSAIGAVAVIEDVSERRRLESVRRDFVANVSHELKTPVGALGLLAETLVDEDDPAVARRLAERMQIEAHRVGRIIEDLLDLSRLEAEEAPLREPVAVHLVVGQAVEQVRQAAEQRGVTIEVGQVSKRVTVVGDRRQLVSAVYNLLENAVKYSEAGATVELESRSDGVLVDIKVSDHGIGIPVADHERIFERFYRVDRGRGRDTGGTGLGLAIVRHVATNHGGQVHVRSREGEGSTFTLRLPAGPGPVAVRRAG